MKVAPLPPFRGGNLSLWLKLSVALVLCGPRASLSARLEKAVQGLQEASRSGSGIALVTAD